VRAQLWDRALETIFANAEDVIARGDMLTVIRWMLRIPERWRSRRINDEILTLSAAAYGHVPESSGVLTEMRPRAPTAPLVHEGVLPVVLFEHAMTLLARGDTQQARTILGAWDELVTRPEALSIVQRHILLAGVALSDNAQNEGTRQLSEAVRVAEIYGLVGVFARAGPMILNRLPDVAGPQAAFRDIILARAQKLTAPGPDFDLPDPLTDRELEILSYLPTRFTNVELAERCFVSVNTIKTHMAHIYRKLDAADRDAAIDRARMLGLL
jgi:DNA-binding CsgD family transcriptional regulator